MRKIGMVLAGMALLIIALPLVAQHAGHSMSGTTTGGYGNHDTAMQDAHKMMLVQAAEEQSAQLHTWIQNTAALSKQMDDVCRLVAANPSADFSDALGALEAALDANTEVHKEFLRNLSKPQRSGLKKAVQKLEKANATLVKASAEINGIPGHASNTKQLARALQKTKEAIDRLQRAQQELATEMRSN